MIKESFSKVIRIYGTLFFFKLIFIIVHFTSWGKINIMTALKYHVAVTLKMQLIFLKSPLFYFQGT